MMRLCGLVMVVSSVPRHVLYIFQILLDTHFYRHCLEAVCQIGSSVALLPDPSGFRYTSIRAERRHFCREKVVSG
jgi:hypothetical protein